MEPLDGFDVVIVDIGSCVADNLDQIGLCLEVGSKNLNDRVRIRMAKCPDCSRELLGAFIFQVVSGDACDHDVLQAEVVCYLRDVRWFEGIKFFSLAGMDGAESTRTGSGVPQDHEGCGLLAPAFRKVWTPCTFADGVQVFRPHHAFDFFDRVGPRHADRQPLGQPLGHWVHYDMWLQHLLSPSACSQRI